MVAFVSLGKEPANKPELYFLSGSGANKLITHKYVNHSPRINRKAIQEIAKDHDFSLVEQLLKV
jgi:hypothetical protein